MRPLTQERLKEIAHYNPKTGAMIWLKPTSPRAKAGDCMGNDDGNGYMQTRIDGKRYRIHRLVWLYTYGTWPTFHIDHKDRNRSNNKLKNLRDIPQAKNNQNMGLSSANTSGYQGVSWSKNMTRWEARISIDDKTKVIGYFDTPTEASLAYSVAKQLYHSAATQ